jgi:soluble lytic murein transglycosylase-like protein
MLLIAALAFPAAAFAASGSGEAAPVGLTDARAVLAPLQRPVDRFQRLVQTVALRIRAEQRAAARQKHREAFATLPGGVSIQTLDAIASCESGGDPRAVSSGGTYRGKYQFDYGTWESVGGHGDPAAASVAEQDYRAALLYSRSGSSPWPVCG